MQSQKESSSMGGDQKLYWQENNAHITENKKNKDVVNNGGSKEYKLAR